MSLRTTLHVCVILLFACILVSPAQAQTFQVGDVFGAVGNGQVNWYHPDGTLVKTLDDLSGGFTTGMAFDKAGNLYVTNFSAGNVSKFDNTGTLIGNLPTAGFGAPESLVFDSAGNLFVGQANSGTISKLDAA